MNPSLLSKLETFGIPYLYPDQERIILRILEHRRLRQVVILPTGAGKSLCFQLPSVFLEAPTLVVFPLNSLIADQFRRLQGLGISAAILCGGQTRRQRKAVEEGLARGTTKVLLTNPETIIQESAMKLLARFRFDHFVIDEAHCVSLWGNQFRPAYRRLGEVLKTLGPERVTAMTATASIRVLEDLGAYVFQNEKYDLIQTCPDRPNIHYSQEPVLSQRLSLTRNVLGNRRPCVVFCRSREGVRHWAHHLHRETNLNVRFYHAGLSQTEKRRVERWFLESKEAVLVTTNAFGMGIDKPDIRTVIHLEKPPTIEDYLQETGRAGRDGKNSRAILFVPTASTSHAIPAVQECRRKSLLHALDYLQESCSGCDVCDGRSSFLPKELETASLALRHHVRRLDRRECKALLSGRKTTVWRESGLEKLTGWGLWKDYDDLTCGELWSGLENGGWIRFSNRGLFHKLLKEVRLF